MIKIIGAVIAAVLIFGACGNSDTPDNTAVRSTSAPTETESALMRITQDEAKRLMDTESDYVILDVRTPSEYDEGHIPGAVLIPDYEIGDRAEAELPDKDALLLVYCRSGRRSYAAAQVLVDMGYTNVREFGGIIDWKYDIEK